MSGLGKVQVPWPERLAMLTRSNFEIEQLGTKQDWDWDWGGAMGADGWTAGRPFGPGSLASSVPTEPASSCGGP
jgi:hypothetical protein